MTKPHATIVARISDFILFCDFVEVVLNLGGFITATATFFGWGW